MKYDFQYQSGARSFEADFGRVIDATDGGFERGYAAGYTEGEQTAKAAAEAANAVILADCNSVLPTKGASTAETLEQVPQRIGEIKSYDEGYDVGVEDGKKAEHDAFWDAYQQNGNRTDYGNGFGGSGWNDETFSPKYNIVVANAYMLFRACAISNLASILERCGVTITLNVNNMNQAFNSTALTHIGGISFTQAFSTIDNVFAYSSKLVEIATTIPVDNCNIGYGFASCTALEEVRFSGTIAQMAYFANSSNLSADSVQSIIDALKDLTGATAQKVTFHKTVGNKLTQAQKDAITAKNWTLVY